MRSSDTLPTPLDLAQRPTPLRQLTRASRRLGVELWIKNDDRTGSVLSGNKIRKLEYLLADATRRKATDVLTCGGIQSNHARATAIAAARLGLGCHLTLRGEAPSQVTGNLLLDWLVGAEVRWVTPEQYLQRHEHMAQWATELRRRGRRPYIIPEGGSNALGSWGYIRAGQELIDQSQGHENPFDSVVLAVGSGGTVAGLAAAHALDPRAPRPVGVPVCDDAAHFSSVTRSILTDMVPLGGPPRPAEAAAKIHWLDGYVGLGYAKSRRVELECLRRFAAEEGEILDPVYSGKAWFALEETLRRRPRALGNKIVFLHTGGVYGLFPRGGDINEVLRADDPEI